jgi:hypothetical protein
LPNPQGTNQFDHFQAQAAYGDVKKAAQLTKEAPMSGAPTSALNAPRRGQKQVVRGQKTQAQPTQLPAVAPLPVAVPDVPYPQYLAQAWSDVAAIPGASPLVKEYAARSQRALERNAG